MEEWMDGVFYGTKKIKAVPMTRQQYNDYRGWDLPDNEDGSDPGYLVEYADGGPSNHPDHAGYISWSPKAVFELSYQSAKCMTFEHALTAMKAGEKVARAGWNGKGLFAYFQPVDGSVHRNYLGLKDVNDTFGPWVPSTSDLLAADWMVVTD